MKYINEPSQPSQSDWRFVKELSQPEQRLFTTRRRTAGQGMVDLSGGVRICDIQTQPERLIQPMTI